MTAIPFTLVGEPVDPKLAVGRACQRLLATGQMDRPLAERMEARAEAIVDDLLGAPPPAHGVREWLASEVFGQAGGVERAARLLGAIARLIAVPTAEAMLSDTRLTPDALRKAGSDPDSRYRIVEGSQDHFSRAMGPQTIVIATDLDGTFFGGSDAQRRALYRLFNEQRLDALLVYNSGRTPLATLADLNEASDIEIPRPDAIIGDIGHSAVVWDDARSAYVPFSPVQAPLDTRWSQAGDVLDRLQALDVWKSGKLRKQDQLQERRLGLELIPGTTLTPEEWQQIEEAVGPDLYVLWSNELYVDILLRGVDKGQTTRDLLSALGAPSCRTLVFGDTGNDAKLFGDDFRGGIVGNARDELRDALAHREDVYTAVALGAGGILEMLLREFPPTHPIWLGGFPFAT